MATSDSKRIPLVAGNWKMNGTTTDNAELLQGLQQQAPAWSGKVQVVVCPAFLHLSQAQQAIAALAAIELGAQNVAEYDGGAYTGEVSAAMLQDFGCQWVILGHSERRSLMGESDQQVAAKLKRVLAAGLSVMVCIGETLAERESDQMQVVLGRQIDAVADQFRAVDAARLVVAYEPVWAIGTGKTASPEMAQQAHAFIRDRLRQQGVGQADQVRLLYGGSVKPANAVELFAQPDIDGGLIGGAALSATDFSAICGAAVV